MDDDIGDVSVDVTADFSGFEARLRAMLARMARKLKIDVPINVDIDTKAANKQLAIWRRLQGRALDVKVELSQASLALVSAQLASLTGVGQLSASFLHFNRTLLLIHESILPVGIGMAGLGAAIGPLTVLLGSLTIAGVDFLTVFGQGMAGVLIALPGLYASAAVGVGVFRLALKDAVAVLGESLTQYKLVQSTVSDNFWAKAEKQVKSLLNNAFKPVNKGMGDVATSAGFFSSRLAQSFNQILTNKDFEKFFGSIAGFFDTLGQKAAGPLASIIRDLLLFGSSLLPKIANNLSTVVTRFSEWLNEAVETGKVTQWLESFGQLLKGIGIGLASLFSIFQGIAKAAADAGISAFPFVDLMQRINDIIQGPAFQNGLRAFFADSLEGAKGLSVAFKPLMDLLAQMAPVIGGFVAKAGKSFGTFFKTLFENLNDPTVISNFQSMLDGFVSVIDNLVPAIGPFVDKLSEMMHFAGILADVVSQSLSVAIQELAPIISVLLTAFEPLVQALGDFITGAITQAAPMLMQVSQGFAGLIGDVAKFVEALDNPVIGFVTGLLLDFFATAISGAINLARGILKIVTGFLQLLGGDFSGLSTIWDGIKTGLQGAFQLFITLFAPAKLLGILGKLIPGAARLFTSLGSKLVSGIGSGLSKLGPLVVQGLSAIPGLAFSALSKLATGAGPLMLTVGQAIVNGLTTGIRALIGGAMVQFGTWIINGIKSILGIASPSRVFTEIGSFLVQGLIAGIQLLLGGLLAVFTNMLTGIKNIFIAGWNFLKTIVQLALSAVVAIIVNNVNFWRNVISSGLSAIRAVVSAVWNGIRAVISGVLGGIRGIISGAWSFIQGATSGAFNRVRSIVASVWNSIRSSVTSGVSSVIKTITSLPGRIGAVAGRFLDAGKRLGKSVIDGLGNGLRAAGGFVQDIGNAIRRKVNGLLGLPRTLGKGPLKFTIPAFANGTNFAPGGPALVGERGPELVYMPRGSQVKTATETSHMMNNFPSTVVLKVGDREFTAYVETVADGRIDAADSLYGQGAA